jgi:hypothetical protein
MGTNKHKYRNQWALSYRLVEYDLSTFKLAKNLLKKMGYIFNFIDELIT